MRNLERAEQRIRRQFQANLATAERDAQERGLRITKTYRANSICILDYLSIKLLKAFAEEYASYLFYSKQQAAKARLTGKRVASARIEQRELNPAGLRKLVPADLKQLVIRAGGLSKAITILRTMLGARGGNWLSSYEAVSYVDCILGCCEDAAGATNSGSGRTYQSLLPYCALCWRRIEQSRFYCQIHHPKQSPQGYYSMRRALLKLLPPLPERNFRSVALPMYGTLMSLAPSHSLINKSLKEGEALKGDNLDLTQKILDFVEEKYPLTHQKLYGIKANQNWLRFCLQVIRSLDDTEAYYWQAKGLDDWLGPKSPVPGWAVLLTVLRRHESYETVIQKPKPRGPSVGAVNKNEAIRSSIVKLARNQIVGGGGVNQAEIAKAIGVSRQRVSILYKELVGSGLINPDAYQSD